MPLIELDDLIRAMRQEDKQAPGIPWSISGVQNLASQIPTIEAAPVVHGRWKGAGMGDYRCSLCDETVSGNYYNYCPYCGAKMA